MFSFYFLLLFALSLNSRPCHNWKLTYFLTKPLTKQLSQLCPVHIKKEKQYWCIAQSSICILPNIMHFVFCILHYALLWIWFMCCLVWTAYIRMPTIYYIRLSTKGEFHGQFCHNSLSFDKAILSYIILVSEGGTHSTHTIAHIITAPVTVWLPEATPGLTKHL